MASPTPTHNPPHILVVTYPAHGHFNPALHFSLRLAAAGVCVTFTSTLYAHRHILPPSVAHPLLSFSPFSDAFDDGAPFSDVEAFMSNLSRVGPSALSSLLRSASHPPFSCVVYTLLLPWAAAAAADASVPSTLLWIQPACVFALYHHFFHSPHPLFTSPASDDDDDRSPAIVVPGVPPLSRREIPSFLLPGDPYPFVLDAIRGVFGALDKEVKPPRVLVNTFDELEASAMSSVAGVELAGVGPLIPSSVGAERERGSDEIMEWLDAKPRGSVVYVSFGTVGTVGEREREEVGRGLRELGRPYLWVVRGGGGSGDEGLGKVVEWCEQAEVVAHEAVGCFVTHGGWNSTTEGLAAGVPMVCCPRWSDQMMNGKMIAEEWNVGVRAKVRGEEGIDGGELKRCVEEVMGERGEEFRRNAARWRDIARAAVADGGSSHRNVKAFIASYTPNS